jgi:hypothetical protein
VSTAPIRLAELDAPLPSIEMPDGRLVTVRRAPASLIDTLAPIAEQHGDRSWQYFRALLKTGAPDLTDAELDALSVQQATVLAKLILHGYEEARALLEREAPPADPSGNAAEATGTTPAPSTSDLSVSSPSA